MQIIDKLISVTRELNWDEVERILLDYWTQQCPFICAPTKDSSFDFKIDEDAFSESFDIHLQCEFICHHSVI